MIRLPRRPVGMAAFPLVVAALACNAPARAWSQDTTTLAIDTALYVLVPQSDLLAQLISLERDAVEFELEKALTNHARKAFHVASAADADQAVEKCAGRAVCDIVVYMEKKRGGKIVLGVTVYSRDRLHDPERFPPAVLEPCGLQAEPSLNWKRCRTRYFDVYARKIVKHHADFH